MPNLSLSVTLVLIGITCLISFLAWKSPALMARLILWPPAVARRGQIDRLITYGFVHADGTHLLFNMITLYFFGGLIERLYTSQLGSFGFIAFYLGALLVSILPSYSRHRQDPDYRSLGASGAVSAVLFAFILIQPWALIIVFVIPLPAILYAVLYVGYSIWMDRRGGDNINHSAHLWGAAYGVVFTVLMDPRILRLFLTQLFDPQFGP
jgi:membrane associated rhomboid family serine protease